MACVEVIHDGVEPIGTDSVNVVLKNYLLTDRFVLKAFDLHPASDGLLGFLGDHFKLNVKYALDGVVSELTLFVKSIPRDNQNRAEFNEKYGMFEREATVYGKILSQFKEEKDSSAWCPKCFLVMKNDLVFEDLNVKGFQMQDLRKTLDREHTMIVLTSLARFHAASIILEESKSAGNAKLYRLHNEFKNELKGGCFVYNDWFKVGIETALLLAAQSENFGKNTPYFNKVQSELHSILKEGLQQCSLSNTTRNVLSHVDLWNNNIMFRHDSKGKPVQCVFVDYQACRVTPPAADILSFIYMNVGKSQRDKSFENFFTHYYNELSQILSENSIDVSDVFPWDEFRQSCEDFKKWGLVQGIIIFQFVFMETSLVLKTLNSSEYFFKLINERRDMLVENLKSDPIFCDRIMSNIDDLIRLYIVNDNKIE